jgi:hypothetical protein
MKIRIYKDGDHCIDAEVEDTRAVPDAMFTVSQHYSTGTFVACEHVGAAFQAPKLSGTSPESRLFSLTTEWL